MMTTSLTRRMAAIGVAVALLVAAAAVALSANHRTADARPAASIPALKPLKVVHRGHDVIAHYSAPGTSGAVHRLRALPRAHAADLRAGFAVLSRPQTASEHGDFDIQQLVQDVPTAQLNGARALNAAHTVWLIPTTDGLVCIGMKTDDGATTFVHVCGPAANALSTGISMTHGDGKLALLPDDAHAAKATIKGTPQTTAQDVSGNYVWLPDGGTVTFSDASGSHTL
jgi:hypothetical protein